MSDSPAEQLTVTLAISDWLLVQDAVDTEIYETEHSPVWRSRRREIRQARLSRLHELNHLFGQITGRGDL
jgi:hypothetical protein